MSERLVELGLAGARVAFTTRRGGVSGGPFDSLNLGFLTDDAPANVGENRARVARDCELDPPQVAMAWQVHGAELIEWDAAPGGGGAYGNLGAPLRKADGHLTAARGVALLVLVADCLPVALSGGGRVAMLHCGWRPLAAGILERALASFDEPPAAAIGPGIGRCCYEVGPEVLAEFAALEGVAEGRMLDLRAVARRKLEAGGVSELADVDRCTACEPETFFSHRRDGGVTGRQAGLVWMPA